MKLPEAQCHTFALSDKRILSYYTFAVSSGENVDSRHPVLYLHGFPKTGLDGAFCADAVAAVGCELFAPDRPGFGFSDALVVDDQDAWIDAFVKDLWELVVFKGWTSFSVIAFSGGGPYTMALLSSYLKMLKTTDMPPAKLEAVSIVAGICCSAGTEGMMSINREIAGLVDTANSWWSRTKLRLMFAVPRFFLSILPDRLMLAFVPPELPDVDKEMLADKETRLHMIRILRSALRQGSWAATFEATILFRSKELARHEKGFCQLWKDNAASSSIPRVSIFHGERDVNVPLSHSKYLYKTLFQEDPKVTFRVYKDMGHASLAGMKQNDYAQCVAPASAAAAAAKQ